MNQKIYHMLAEIKFKNNPLHMTIINFNWFWCPLFVNFIVIVRNIVLRLSYRYLITFTYTQKKSSHTNFKWTLFFVLHLGFTNEELENN